MTFTGVFINAGGVLLAGILGSIFRKGLPEKIRAMLMTALGLCVLYIGASGISADTNFTRLVLAVSIGTIIGTAIDIDKRLRNLGEKVHTILPVKDDGFADGFISATLFVCVGAMAIVGAIESGTKGTYDVYLAKSFIDILVVFVMASTKGAGCSLAAVTVLIYELLITLLAGFIAQIVSEEILTMMSQIGSLLIIGIALNLLEITNIRIANLLLCPFIPILFGLF